MRTRTRARAAMTMAVPAALIAGGSLAFAPAASAAAPAARCTGWVPVHQMEWLEVAPFSRVSNTALRIRSCTQVTAYTGIYKGKRRAAVRIVGTAQVWNTYKANTGHSPEYVNLLRTVSDVGISRTAKIYFKLVAPGQTLSYPVTITAWTVKGKSAVTAVSGVSGESPADWVKATSSWKH